MTAVSTTSSDEHDDRVVDRPLPGSARRPCAARPGPRAANWRLAAVPLLLGRGSGCGGALRAAAGSPSAPSAPWRWSIRFVSRFIAMGESSFGESSKSGQACVDHRTEHASEQGRRDSNPQPPVLETGALPVELLPSGDGPVDVSTRPRRPSKAIRRSAAPSSASTTERSADEPTAAHAGWRTRWPRPHPPRWPPRCRRGRRPDGPSSDRTAWRSSGVLERGQDVGEQPGRGLEHLGPQAAQRPEQLRYWTSSAWHRRQCSTWRAGVVGRGRRRRRRRRPAASASVVTPHGRALVIVRHRRALPRQREQLARAAAAGPVEAHLGRRLGDAELGGDGLVGQVVDVAQHDHGPQPGRQLGGAPRRAGRAGRRPRPEPAGSRVGVDVGDRERRRRAPRGGGGPAGRGGSRRSWP